MPDYDEAVYRRCLEAVSREVDQYRLNIHVITALWDFIDNTDSLSSSIQGIEDSIYLADEGREIEPDIIALEEGEHYVLGEFKGRVSDLEIDTCLENIDKYTRDFYSNRDAIDIEAANPDSPRVTFFITHQNHIQRVVDSFRDEYGEFEIHDVPICFLSYSQYEGPGGNDRLRIQYEDGDYADSIILTEIANNRVTEPENDTEYHLPTLMMREFTWDFYFYDAPPPDPYIAVKLREHLDIYRDRTDPASWNEDSTSRNKQEIIQSFKDNHSSNHTSPNSSWIESGLSVLDEYGWIDIDDDTVTINWGEFTKDRQMDDMHKYFAKNQCRETAKARSIADDEENESQSALSDYT